MAFASGGSTAATPREARPNRPFVTFVTFVREDTVVPSAASVVSAVDVETGKSETPVGAMKTEGNRSLAAVSKTQP